jgi:NTP pyrophosphatase (non-canonical NTP hydrolase)
MPMDISSMLEQYVQAIAPTDKLPNADLVPVLMGLFGEVGSIMAVTKKVHREGTAYVEAQRAVEEEFGDVLWYFTALCRRIDLPASEVLVSASVANEQECSDTGHGRLVGPRLARGAPGDWTLLKDSLLRLGSAAAALLETTQRDARAEELVDSFAAHYVRALAAIGVPFLQIVHANLTKACGRFLDPDFAALPTFDGDCPEDERLPSKFEIRVARRASGASQLEWNGVFIGDPLTDNILDRDGYRYHDVFHLAYAAVLHWSPTFRTLIKRKRKSNPVVDEAQDGGRAIVVEEGLTAWIFSRAKELDLFKGQDSLSFDLLKTVQQFVRGYEIAACPLRLWERAILQGYEVFRQVRKQQGGVVIGERHARTIRYEPPPEGAW